MGKAKKDFFDDGRTIANMDVEGMPWNNGYDRWFGSLIPLKKKQYKKAADEQKSENPFIFEEENQLTNKETRVLIFNAVIAALLVAGVFIGAAFLFILFCTKVWFK